MAEIKQGDRIVWARSNDGAEQTGQVAAMTAKNVSRQAELERTMRIILAGQQQRRDISA